MTTRHRPELEPISLVIGSLLRRSWLILGFAGLVGAATWFAAGETAASDTATADARVGITTDAVWPFYDVVLEEGRMIVADPDFRTSLETELGVPVADIRTSIPDALSVFESEVDAADADTAARAANRAAEMVVERGVESTVAKNQAAADALQSQIDALADRIAATRATIDDQVAQMSALQATLDVEYDQATEDQRYAISLERDINQALLADLERERSSLEVDRLALVSAGTPPAAYQVLRLAETTNETDTSRAPLAIGAAVAALLVAAATAVVVDRRVGRVRSAWQLTAVCGAPTAAEITAGPNGFLALGALADQLHRAVDQEHRVIGVVDATAAGVDVDGLASALAPHGLTAAITDEPQPAPDRDLTLVDVSDEYGSPDTPRRRSHLCDAVVVFVDGATGVRAASDLVERADSSPGVLASVLVRRR